MYQHQKSMPTTKNTIAIKPTGVLHFLDREKFCKLHAKMYFPNLFVTFCTTVSQNARKIVTK